ncbi:DNA glycosylase [Wolbachia pipientis]|uniref:Type-4 uracil-DNA glycosylase n=1 Tax=Wolbachia pipientis TaxID=955 RepID=A0A1E7QJT0_WOLPI|nr:uracil-DNA glycosylase [Wolbachia pipientis]OEY86730.1 DNA glycosylase [Wolbachia pipientis]
MNNEDLELLKFYHEIGIDCTMKEAKEEEVEPNPSITARQLASKCSSIEELKHVVESFTGCEIRKTSINTVFADGSPDAKIMLIGEAPGANEDLQGIPFCGASGILLDKMLNAIELDRTKVYISNTVFWRPPGNRKPTDLELDMCKPFVEKHIALINPQVLVLVGGIACYSLLDRTRTISNLRGKFYTYTNQYLSNPITTTVIFHPAYLLRQPLQKRLAWEDLKKIREYINTL